MDVPPPADTAEARARAMVAYYAPCLRGPRLPAYQTPALTVEPQPACAPAFAEAMRALCKRLDLNDPAICPADVAHLLRYHRMNGLPALYKAGLTAVERLAPQDYHRVRTRELGFDLVMLVGDLLFTLLGPTACTTWFPWHTFTVLLKGAHGFRVLCQSLATTPGRMDAPSKPRPVPPRCACGGRRGGWGLPRTPSCAWANGRPRRGRTPAWGTCSA
jgi:hypothetical protein